MIRFNIILIVFVLFVSSVYVVAFRIEGRESKKVKTELINAQNSLPHHFYYADYFSLKAGKPWLFLNAEELIVDDQKNIQTINPQGRFYQLKKAQKGQADDLDEVPMNYRALFGKYIESQHYLRLIGQVELWQTTPIFERHFKAEKVIYFLDKKKIEAEQRVQSTLQNFERKQKVLINAEALVGYPEQQQFYYSKQVSGEVRPEKAYHQPINFQSERLDADLKLQQLVLLDNVVIKKQETVASSRKADIFLENQNKNLKYYVLYDDIKIVQKVLGQDGKPLLREAFAEKLEGFALEQKLVLTGAPKVYQGKDSVKGNMITLRENAELIEVDNSNSVIAVKPGQ